MCARSIEKLAFEPFEFEPQTGRLYKHGLRVKLQPKSAAVLECLLAQPHEVVTREHLQAKLWQQGTHVDFGLGIKVAVKKLRDALGDSTDEPVYIQTIPGHGYRFIANVDRLQTPADPPQEAIRTQIGEICTPDTVNAEPPRTNLAPRLVGWCIAAFKLRTSGWKFASIGVFAAFGFTCFAILAIGLALRTSRPLLGARARSTPNRRFVYVTDYSQNRVLGFSVNPSNGRLEPLAATPVKSGEHPYRAMLFPNDGFLYVTNRGLADGVCGEGCNISAYAVDQVSGNLEELPGSPFSSGSGTAAIAGHPSGKFLYAANVISNDVYAYSRDYAGGLHQIGSPVPVGARPFFLAMLPSGRFLYAVNQDDATISGFRVSKDGRLSAIGGSPFHTGLRPRTFTVDPSGRFAYVLNYGVNPYSDHEAACLGTYATIRGRGCSVSIFSIDQETGFLTEVAGSPVEVRGTNPIFSLFDSQGKYLFVLNIGSNNISVFRRDNDTGTIREVAGSPFSTSEGPASAALDWSDGYIYVQSGYAPTIDQFSIAGDSGRLSRVGAPIHAGLGLSHIVAEQPF